MTFPAIVGLCRPDVDLVPHRNIARDGFLHCLGLFDLAVSALLALRHRTVLLDCHEDRARHPVGSTACGLSPNLTRATAERVQDLAPSAVTCRGISLNPRAAAVEALSIEAYQRASITQLIAMQAAEIGSGDREMVIFLSCCKSPARFYSADVGRAPGSLAISHWAAKPAGRVR
jgi:hypothetical protein